jgi:hypothetical protein
VRGYPAVTPKAGDLRTDAMAKGTPRSLFPYYAVKRIQRAREVKVRTMYLASISVHGKPVNFGTVMATEKEAFAMAAEMMFIRLVNIVPSEMAAIYRTEIDRAKEADDPETALIYLNMKKPQVVQGDVCKISVPVLTVSNPVIRS